MRAGHASSPPAWGPGSNGPLWSDSVLGWPTYFHLFAPHFRVIAPDTRGHGRTRNPSGVMHWERFAQDVIALAETLELDHPLICGMSDGGCIADLVGILALNTYRQLHQGEFGVLPGTDHQISPLACTLIVDFLLRQRG